jgi:LPXTG-motif cell wall-anchored protein
MNWEAFTPWSALIGGALIGVAASILLLFSGRVAGISGVIGGLLLPKAGEIGWRLAFVIGLALASVAMLLLAPDSFGASPRSLPLVVVAGALVGVGTRIGNGCTSGHGVCGLSRLSIRSLAATLTFMTTGVLAATAARVLWGGAL